jgi:hypothetical protein
MLLEASLLEAFKADLTNPVKSHTHDCSVPPVDTSPSSPRHAKDVGQDLLPASDESMSAAAVLQEPGTAAGYNSERETKALCHESPIEREVAAVKSEPSGTGTHLLIGTAPGLRTDTVPPPNHTTDNESTLGQTRGLESDPQLDGGPPTEHATAHKHGNTAVVTQRGNLQCLVVYLAQYTQSFMLSVLSALAAQSTSIGRATLGYWKRY